jgi:uncharacterized protein
MRVFGISDLHLSFTSNKPMDKFGAHWYQHHDKIAAAWREMVREEDVVLIPGDHSWALKLSEAATDLRWIGELPGIKIMGKGNHDLWWHSIKQLDALGLPQTRWLQNNAYVINGVGLCGTRGWSLPAADSSAEDQKIFARELERLKLSFQALEQERRRGAQVKTVVCMLHYPPLASDRAETPMTALLEANQVDLCIYGHMHLSHQSRVVRDVVRGVRYEVVSCDFADFAPRLLLDVGAVVEATA